MTNGGAEQPINVIRATVMEAIDTANNSIRLLHEVVGDIGTAMERAGDITAASGHPEPQKVLSAWGDAADRADRAATQLAIGARHANAYLTSLNAS
jgi:hypothetical protein